MMLQRIQSTLYLHHNRVMQSMNQSRPWRQLRRKNRPLTGIRLNRCLMPKRHPTNRQQAMVLPPVPH